MIKNNKEIWTTIRVKESNRNKLRMYQGMLGFTLIDEVIDIALIALDKKIKSDKKNKK